VTQSSPATAGLLSQQLIEASKRATVDTYSATMLLHASAMIDQLVANTRPAPASDAVAGEATPAMVAAGIEACDGRLHASSIRRVWSAMSALRAQAATPPASKRMKISHPSRPDEADYEYDDLQRRISSMGGDMVVVGILQMYALASPRQGSYAGSLWAIAEWLGEQLATPAQAASEPPLEDGKR
jgi:hypothetical protein